MWLGILTPGAHPSRPISIAEATVFAWTPEGRHRIDGPFAMVHGGLRTLRRTFHGQGLVACPPRCFVCLEPCPMPDTDEVRAFDGMTDSSGAAAFRSACAQAGVPVQDYSHRGDLSCGSTIGPLASAQLAIRTGDVGMAQLSMHSARELMAVSDVAAMVAAFTAWCVPD